MRKVCLLFGSLLALALVLVVAGCGGGSGSSDSTTGAGTTAGQTTESAAAKSGGAGGDSAAPKGTPAEEKTRSQVQKIVDAKLPDFGLSSDEIACVDENIATMNSQSFAGVTRPSGGETAAGEEETAENFLGPLADGCL